MFPFSSISHETTYLEVTLVLGVYVKMTISVESTASEQKSTFVFIVETPLYFFNHVLPSHPFRSTIIHWLNSPIHFPVNKEVIHHSTNKIRKEYAKAPYQFIIFAGTGETLSWSLQAVDKHPYQEAKNYCNNNCVDDEEYYG